MMKNISAKPPLADASEITPQNIATKADSAPFKPKIAAFVCNWCTYAGADLTGTSRIKYASNVRILRFPCTGRIDFMLLMKAFSNGVDGIIVSGCHPNDCHYTSGNFHARRRWIVFKSLLDFVGIDSRRIAFSWVSAAEGAKWAKLVNNFTETVTKLGPYRDYRQIIPGWQEPAQLPQGEPLS